MLYQKGNYTSLLVIVLLLIGLCYSQCPNRCQKCENSSECQECYSGNYLTSKNQCQSCPSGTYYSALNTCSACSQGMAGCQSCTSATSCQNCHQSYKLVNSKCIACQDYNLNCGKGYYKNLSDCSCKSCVYNCDSCSNNSQCQTCKSNYYLTSDKKCATCPQGQYYYSTNTCRSCSSSINGCQDCKHGSYCYTCKPFYKKMNNQYCRHCASINMNCGEGKFKNMYDCSCKDCIPNCKTCSNDSQCSQCKDGYEFNSESKTCEFSLSTCPSGYIMNNGACEKHTNYIGCYRDNRSRDLYKSVGNTFTIETCRAKCKQQGFAYAGVQYGGQCFCDNNYGSYGQANNCDKPCSHDSTQICGGSWANSVFSTDWFHVGCHRDKSSRDLAHFAGNIGNVDKCLENCQSKGYSYAGVQNGNQCFCDSNYGRYGVADNCNKKCSSQSSKICGGSWANNVYGVVNDRIYVGCYKDSRSRDLNHYIGNNRDIQQCVRECTSKGYKYAGLQWYGQCFCGKSYGKYGSASNCDRKCNKNQDQICGGSWANSVYQSP